MSERPEHRQFRPAMADCSHEFSQGDDMLKPCALACVVYQTRQFDTMTSWYRTVFGAPAVHPDAALA
jgi:hypothetical protein